MEYIRHGGLGVLPMDDRMLPRCFDLMLKYADVPIIGDPPGPRCLREGVGAEEAEPAHTP